MTDIKTLKREMLKDPEVRKKYEELGPIFEISAELIRARKTAGMTQQDVAKKMGTTQPTIARIESGTSAPSTQTIMRYAEVTGHRVKFRLVRHRR